MSHEPVRDVLVQCELRLKTDIFCSDNNYYNQLQTSSTCLPQRSVLLSGGRI